MITAPAETGEALLSEVPDAGSVPLSTDVSISGADYARVMRRIGVHGGEAGPPVSAFNSSI